MADWKNNLQKTRYVMDALLLLSFMLLSAPQATGIALHEWFSLVFIIPFVIHILLHWKWFKASFGLLISRVSLGQRFDIVWSYLMYFTMVLSFVSGVLVSVALLPTLNIELHIQDFWSKIHHDSSTLLMPMLGVHLALNWSWIVRLSKKMLFKESEA